MLVKEAMHRNVKTVRKDSTVQEAAKIMTKNRIGSLVVVSSAGELEGIATERDIMTNVVAEGLNSGEVTVEDIMTTEVITISPDSSLEEAANLMSKSKIKKLPVVENGEVIGIITASDLIRYEESLTESISDLIAHSPTTGLAG